MRVFLGPLLLKLGEIFVVVTSFSLENVQVSILLSVCFFINIFKNQLKLKICFLFWSLTKNLNIFLKNGKKP